MVANLLLIFLFKVWFQEMNLINLHLNPNIETDPEELILKIDLAITL
jgi:hypothetical protein